MELQEILERVTEGKATALNVAKKVLDGKETVSLVIEQRQLLPEAPRAPIKRESDARSHVFFEVKSFAAYLEKYGTKDTVVFGDPQEGIVYATLDETKKDGVEVLFFKPMLHPQWAPWEALIGKKMEIASFVEFVLNNRNVVTEPDARELVYNLSQIKATSTTEIQRGRGKNSVNGVMVTNRIQGVDKQELVELPEDLTLHVPIYIRTDKRKLMLALCIEAGEGSEILCSLSSGDILEAKVDAFDDMFESLEALKAKGATVTLGKVKHQPWRYLSEQEQLKIGSDKPVMTPSATKVHF